MLRRRRLERVQYDVSVQRVSGNDAPVVKHLRAKRLALRWRQESDEYLSKKGLALLDLKKKMAGNYR